MIRPCVAPAATLGLAVRRSGRWDVEVGAAGAVDGAPVDETTPFDLASVSKPFVACSFARLWRSGLLAPETELGAVLGECVGTGSERAPISALLSHRAGLEAHRPLFAPLERGRPFDAKFAIEQAANARRRDAEAAPSPRRASL
ncbi:MAG: serine hydrolase domain-containing protein [Polyangiaceae bacterium]